MAILEGIRKKTGLLLVFVAGALLLFLVQGFADDLLKFTGADESVYKGQIGDERIKNDLFEAKSQQKEQLARYNYAQSGQEFPEYLVNRIESEVWNELVYEHGFKAFFEDAGVFVTENGDSKGSPEIVDLMQGITVSDEVKQAFTREGEAFDVENVKNQWRQIAKIQDQNQKANETYRMNAWVKDLARQRHMEKYTSLFTKSFYVSTIEAKRQHYANNSIVSFDVAYIPFTSVADSLLKAEMTEDALKKHLEANKNKFEFKDGRTVEYVVFDVAPSKADTTKAFAAANKIADGFRKSTNDTAFYKTNSDRPTQPSLFSYDQLPSQLKEDTGYLGKGFVKGPVPEYGSYDVYKIIDKKKIEMAQTAHILISFNGPDSAAVLKKSLEVLAKAKAGEDFGALAAQYSEDPGSKDNKGEYPATEKGSGWVKEFEDAVFGAKKTGVLPNLVKTQFGYHIMKILKTPYKEEKFVVVKLSKEIKPSSATRDMEYRKVNVFAQGIDNITDLKAKVEADKKLEWITSPLLSKKSKSIGSVYNADEVVIWAYSSQTEIGDVKIFSIPNSGKYVVAALKSVSDKTKPQVDDARQAIERSLYNELKAKKIKELLDGTKGDLHEKVNALNAKNGQGYAKFEKVIDHKFSTNYVQNIGNEPRLVGLAMALGTANGGEWSKAAEVGESGVFIVRTTAKTEANKAAVDYNAEKKEIEAKKAPNATMSNVANAIKEKVGVKDNDN
jgi:peptidyl-prolyl cis-trans isomerase D